MLNSMERAAWLRRAGYGFFLHYLNGAAGCGGGGDNSIEAWNRRTDNFDVDKLALQLHQLGAGYCFLTLGQNTGYYCSPNKEYERLLGFQGNDTKMSSRDLFMDMANALEKYNIPLLAYTTAMAPVCDDRAIVALGFLPPWKMPKIGVSFDHLNAHIDHDPRIKRFLRNWENIHREWAERYGSKLKGWWVDGCYYPKEMFDHPDAPNFASFAAALRAGNPDALVALAPGVKYPPVKLNDVEDYTAGEINEPWRGVHNGAELDGIQYQILTFAGKFWGAQPLMYSGSELAAISKNIIKRGGAITWDVPFSYENGTFLDDFFAAFLQMREILSKDAAPLVDNEFELIKSPSFNASGDSTPGLARIATNSPDPVSFEWLGRKFKVNAGQKQEIVLDAPAQLPKTGIIRAAIRYGEFEHCYTIPVLQQHNISALKDFVIYSSAGEELGRLSAQVIAGNVEIHAFILDPEHRPHQVVWQGSCVEFLFTGDGTKENLIQIFNTPEGQSTVSKDSNFVKFEPASVTAKDVEGGYTIDFSMPLSAIPGLSGNSFKMEVHATLMRDKTVVDGVVFGTRGILQDLHQYGTMFF
jgi:hypothetical protein